MIGKILALLGLGNGGSVTNNVLGTFNILALAPLGVWLYAHKDEQVSFTVSLGFLALLCGIAYVLVEINRRAEYRHSSPDERDNH